MLRDSAKDLLTDVTTGLYMISATCGLVDAVCFVALGGVFAEMMTGTLLLMGHFQLALTARWARRPATSPPSWPSPWEH